MQEKTERELQDPVRETRLTVKGFREAMTHALNRGGD